MATLYRCDRCGKTDTTSLEKISIPPPENRSDYRQERNLDLCNFCLVDLNKFADPLPLESRRN